MHFRGRDRNTLPQAPPTLHNLFADTRERAIVTEAAKNETIIVEGTGNYMVMTNFSIVSMAGKAYFEAQGKGSDRYVICHEYLDRYASDFNVDCALAASYLMMAATSRGLGTCWVNFGTEIQDPELKQALGIPDGDTIVAPIALGYPEKIPPRNEINPTYWQSLNSLP